MENTTEIRQQITKIMEKESAIKVLIDIKDKIGGVDLSSICDESDNVLDEISQDATLSRVVQAIQCGLVYWDENKNVLVQKLIYPIKCGQINAELFEYRKRLTINELSGLNANDQIDLFANLLAQIVSRPIHLIRELKGQDTEVAMGCLSFFAK